MAKILIGCACDDQGNLGLPQDYCKEGVIIGFAIQNKLNSTGVANKIDLDVTSITTEWTSLLSSTDKTTRINPLMMLRNYAEQNAEQVVVTDNQGIDEPVRDGDRKFTIERWNTPALLAEKINAWKCKESVIYFYTDKGVLGYKVGDDFTGIPLAMLHAIYAREDGANPSRTLINGQLDRDAKVGNFWFIKYEDLNTTKLGQVGFSDVTLTIVDAAVDSGTNTTVGFKVRSPFGNGLVANQNIAGLVLADLSIKNMTTNTAIVGVSLVEIENEKYTLTFPSQTTADKIKISVSATNQSPYLEGSLQIAQPA